MLRFFSTFILLLFASFSFAQISVGAKAGVNYAYFPDVEDGVVLNFSTQAIIAPHMGAFAEFGLSERFAISTELLYSVKGSKIEQFIIFAPSVQTFSTSYVSVPILGKIKLRKLGILGGVEPSAIISERVRFNNDPWQTAQGLSNTFDFSLIGGLDVRVKKLYFTARYIHGLSSALTINFTNENGEAIGEGTNPNRVFQISAGYYFL